MGEIQRLAVHVSLVKQPSKGSLAAPSTGILREHHSCLWTAHLARMFDSTLMSSEPFHAKHSKKRRRQIFIGFSGTKDIDLSPRRHHIPGVDEVYHGNDNQPDDSTTILECLVSDLYSTFQYREFDPFFECVFICPLFCFDVYRMHCVNVDMRMHAQICQKLKKRSPYQYFFTTYEMPLVISCRFLGMGITTSVPTRVRFTQMRGPNERVATALY